MAPASVWTGSHLISWGGLNFSLDEVNTGGLYDPASDAWSATTTTGVPGARAFPRAVWTGSKMIVWGGWNANLPGIQQDSGSLYDPVANSWSSMTTAGAPEGRGFRDISNGTDFEAVWTGSRMMIWGGRGLNTGGLYDPVTDHWTATTLTGAPSERQNATLVWTGGKALLWGGSSSTGFNTGYLFDPQLSVVNSWSAITTTGAPSVRYGSVSVWTGSKMIVYGGNSLDDQPWMYEPSTDTWTAGTWSGSPGSRMSASVAWTGSRMIVWGGVWGFRLNDGFLYDPQADTWTAMTTQGAPGVREQAAAVWTGSQFIVWGGTDDGASGLNDGSIYTPGGSDGTPPPVGDGTGVPQ